MISNLLTVIPGLLSSDVTSGEGTPVLTPNATDATFASILGMMVNGEGQASEIAGTVTDMISGTPDSTNPVIQPTVQRTITSGTSAGEKKYADTGQPSTIAAIIRIIILDADGIERQIEIPATLMLNGDALAGYSNIQPILLLDDDVQPLLDEIAAALAGGQELQAAMTIASQPFEISIDITALPAESVLVSSALDDMGNEGIHFTALSDTFYQTYLPETAPQATEEVHGTFGISESGIPAAGNEMPGEPYSASAVGTAETQENRIVIPLKTVSTSNTGVTPFPESLHAAIPSSGVSVPFTQETGLLVRIVKTGAELELPHPAERTASEDATDIPVSDTIADSVQQKTSSETPIPAHFIDILDISGPLKIVLTIPQALSTEKSTASDGTPSGSVDTTPSIETSGTAVEQSTSGAPVEIGIVANNIVNGFGNPETPVISAMRAVQPVVNVLDTGVQDSAALTGTTIPANGDASAALHQGTSSFIPEYIPAVEIPATPAVNNEWTVSVVDGKFANVEIAVKSSEDAVPVQYPDAVENSLSADQTGRWQAGTSIPAVRMIRRDVSGEPIPADAPESASSPVAAEPPVIVDRAAAQTVDMIVPSDGADSSNMPAGVSESVLEESGGTTPSAAEVRLRENTGAYSQTRFMATETGTTGIPNASGVGTVDNTAADDQVTMNGAKEQEIPETGGSLNISAARTVAMEEISQAATVPDQPIPEKLNATGEAIPAVIEDTGASVANSDIAAVVRGHRQAAREGLTTVASPQEPVSTGSDDSLSVDARVVKKQETTAASGSIEAASSNDQRSAVLVTDRTAVSSASAVAAGTTRRSGVGIDRDSDTSSTEPGGRLIPTALRHHLATAGQHVMSKAVNEVKTVYKDNETVSTAGNSFHAVASQDESTGEVMTETMPENKDILQSTPELDMATGNSVKGNISHLPSAGMQSVGTQTTDTFAQTVDTVHSAIASRGSQVDAGTVAETIVRSARIMVQNGESSARIQLEPPSLGKLQLDIVTVNSKVTGRIIVENAEVRDIVQNNLSTLRDNLAQSGLKVESFDVQVGHNGGTDGWARMETFRQGRRYTDSIDGSGRMSHSDDDIETTAPISVQTIQSPYSRVFDRWM
jgi:flagellar hook-length control protein FliK